MEDLPVVEVFRTSDGDVVVKWGEGAANSTSVLQPGITLYSEVPYSFSAVDSNGVEPFIKTFGTLLGCDGGVLTIGETRYRIQAQRYFQPPPQPPQFSETAKAGLELMAEDYLAKKRTIVLSDATSAAKNDLMDMLNLPEKGASWPNKPAVSQHVDGFSWLKGDEDCLENRTAYMAYLKNILQLPAHYALADAQPNRKLLTVELVRDIPESRKISGTTNVAIAKSEHVRNAAIRNNIETLLELKTPTNMRKKDHTPQTIGEHFAASYLNPDHAVVSVLTDLNQNWTFFWFARGEDDSKVALYKLCLNGGEATADAKYLLDSLYGNSVGDTLPTTFANRQPFQAILDSIVRNKRVRREFDTSNQINPCAAGGGGSAPMSMASTLSQFAPPTDRDVANELDLLEMVDESEQYEIVRSFASKYIVPYMTG